MQLSEDRDEVALAPEGTPLAEFQKERTAAISEMFDGPDDCGICPTSHFFARLDSCVSRLLAAADRDRRFAEAVRALTSKHQRCFVLNSCTDFASEIDDTHQTIYDTPCTAQGTEGK